MGPRPPHRSVGSLDDLYVPHHVIGEGAHGTVWLLSAVEDGQEYACKVVRKSELNASGCQKLQSEVAMHCALSGRHAGIVRLQEVLETPDSVNLVMERCRGGDLFELLSNHGRLPEAAAKGVFRQVASALEFCHDQGVLHRDIKLENILFDVPAKSLYFAREKPSFVNAKLADFGLAVAVGRDGSARGLVGSRFYTSPETVRENTCGAKSDMWSLGVVLHAMLSGQLPFYGDNLAEVQAEMLKGQVKCEGPSWEGVSEAARALVMQLLQQSPEARLTARQVLKHSWLAEGTPRKCLSWNRTRHGSCSSDESEVSWFSAWSCESESACRSPSWGRGATLALVECLSAKRKARSKLGGRVGSLARSLRRYILLRCN